LGAKEGLGLVVAYFFFYSGTVLNFVFVHQTYPGADKSLAQPTSRCILFGENISFDASLVIYEYINSSNIPPIMIINWIYEHHILLSL